MKMTANEAKTFDRFSAHNAAVAESSRDCNCVAYVDIFTLKRWNAQGMKVKSGEKSSSKIPVVRMTTVKDDEGKPVSVRSFRKTALFCRCQVEIYA